MRINLEELIKRYEEARTERVERRDRTREKPPTVYIQFEEGHPCYDYVKYFSAIGTKRELADAVCPLLRESGIFEEKFKKRAPEPFNEVDLPLDELIEMTKELVGRDILSLKKKRW